MSAAKLNGPICSLVEWLEVEKAEAFDEYLKCPTYDKDASRWLSRSETMKDVLTHIKEQKGQS